MYKILSFLHKLTGSLLCLLFFMWFTSGIVLSYAGWHGDSGVCLNENNSVSL